ncbi:hypothetical protein M3661_25300 [Paenibacillus sp. MER 180]|uniref:hypothetical protein n=1 Tax=Paenibacillus sp. MER 180 TaxID=2939570 RepID=UPI00203C7DB3|nr:hypothetical protein [Paenibacillus sp. MER 180]MCM3293426.1 hypothetical protein [Paenibacillus sp. MER 180]
MKRYLFSIILGLCTLGILCTYYTYGAADHLPAYKLVTVQGDRKEGAGIELSGNYGGIGSESLSINMEGSKYRSRETFRDQIFSVRSWRDFSEGMGQLIRDHRQFMRGKSVPNGFYKDAEWLIYAKGNIVQGQSPQKQYQLHVDLLNLKTNEEQQYVTEIPTDSTFDYIYVNDVQRINDQLHVLIMQDKRDESSQYFDYVLDMKSGTLIEGKQVTHWKKNSANKDIEIEVSLLSNYIAPNEYTVFQVQENKVTSRGDYTYSSDPIAVHLYVYSYRTGKLSALPDPKQLDPKQKINSNKPYYLESNSLVYANFDENAIQLSRYNLSTGLEERDYVKIEASELGADRIQTVVQTNNRVSILMKKGSTHLVVIVDASNGKTRYVGQVTYEGPESERDKELGLLRLNNLNIREMAI